MSGPQLGGAGPAGGLLFVGVLIFLGWLVATGTTGVLRIVLLSVLGLAIGALTADVVRRR